MYFIYKKQINVASEYSYNVDSIRAKSLRPAFV